MPPTLRAAIIAKARTARHHRKTKSVTSWFAHLDAGETVCTELRKITSSEAERNPWYARVHRIVYPDHYYGERAAKTPEAWG